MQVSIHTLHKCILSNKTIVIGGYMDKLTKKNSDGDLRVRYTKLIAKQSLLEILQDKHISKVTIKELCEKANINRATFYRHYYDIYDLLSEIEFEIFEEIRTIMVNDSDDKTSIENICHVIKKNSDVCNVLLGKNGAQDTIDKLLALLKEDILKDWIPTQNPYIDYAFEFTTNGSLGIIRKWQERNYSDPPETIAKLIADLNNKGLSSLIKG